MHSILIICEDSPFGKNAVLEALRLATGILAVGDIEDCQVVLLKDAIHVLHKRLQPAALNVDPIDDILKLIKLSEVEIIVSREDLEFLGLTEQDLLPLEHLTVANHEMISELILYADFTFKY